jgi:GxxExxY protein
MAKNILEICDIIRTTSVSIHAYLRSGHLEKVYENALIHRLRKNGLKVESQHPLKVLDEDGTLLGDFYADLIVENELIVEIKACRALTDDHFAQILGYLRASRREHGLLINFGAAKLQIRKFILN